uniref:Uncharacterized protein n=1 Tax=Romanomermis culicivorax TaxID=13658 RepID=A0A915L056_ROMCU
MGVNILMQMTKFKTSICLYEGFNAWLRPTKRRCTILLENGPMGQEKEEYTCLDSCQAKKELARVRGRRFESVGNRRPIGTAVGGGVSAEKIILHSGDDGRIENDGYQE